MTDAVKIALIASVPGSLAAILGIFNRVKLGSVSLQIDGRLTELLQITKSSSHAQGVKDELDREK
jgi:hypothetical protein